MALEKLEGTLERVVYANAQTGFAVVRLSERGSAREVTAVGPLAHLAQGADLKLWGRWVTDLRHGLQFRVRECVHQPPTSATGIERYLASGLIKGIGAKLAARIVERFGDRTLEVIEREPGRLAEVPDLGKKRIEQIVEAFAKQKDIRDTLVFLGTYGIGRGLALKIHGRYGERTMAVLQKDPYRLVRDVHGVGFRTADIIARKLGLPEDAPERVRAATRHVLEEATTQGHCYLPVEELVRETGKLLARPVPGASPGEARGGAGVPEGPVRGMVEAMAAARELVLETPDAAQPATVAYLEAMHDSECWIADEVARLARERPVLTQERVDAALAHVQQRLSIRYHELQAEGIRMLGRTNVMVITGGPGTGKTTLLKGLIEVLAHSGITFGLAAPTGRAAKRIEESTGHPAQTLHRMLKFQPRDRSFMVNRLNPLPALACVVDEASMIDLPLFESLLKALKAGTILVVVGDVDQLPSIGPGAVLRDLIDGGLPTVRLKHVFRQSRTSLIVDNAHRINAGEMPVLPSREDGSEADFYFFERDNPAGVAKTVVELVGDRIPRRFGFDPVRDVQVLVPMYRGEAGVENLNRELRDKLNAAGADVGFGDKGWRLGDKVIQQSNDYDRDVFNGDIGILVAADPQAQVATVDFDGRRVAYKADELDQLQLAYAVSVHKSQGSEYPAVVIPVHTQHFIMLQRNLLYTAVTRARKLVVLVGSRNALSVAVGNERVVVRYTRLAERLRARIAGRGEQGI